MIAPASRTFDGLLREVAAEVPLARAAVHDRRSVDYAALAERSGRLAAGLSALGIGRGDRVGLLMENRLEWLEAFFAGAMLGATTVPFSTWSRPGELAFMMNDAEIGFLITVDSFAGHKFGEELAALVPELSRLRGGATLRSAAFPALRGIGNLGAARAGMIRYEALFDETCVQGVPPESRSSAEDDALILYSSGSTRRPKAIRLRHQAVIENGFNIGRRMGLRCDDRILLSPPLFWSYGSANALPAALTHRAALVLISKFEAESALVTIENESCTVIYTLPSITSALVHHPAFRPSRTKSLRTGLTIGTPKDVRQAAESLGARAICNVYGATETCGNCCVTPHDMPLRRRMRCQGAPLPGMSIRILDAETGKPAGPGRAGQVEVGGYLMSGYAGESAALNGSVLTEDGYFRTGDIGYLDESGNFVFVSRGDDVIKRDGINISPIEVEDLLLSHPSVKQAAVVGIPAGDEVRVFAFVTAGNGSAPCAAELRAHCRSIASSYKCPDEFILLDELPTTTTGKILRRELRQRAREFADG